jgi:hypothetical protein
MYMCVWKLAVNLKSLGASAARRFEKDAFKEWNVKLT